MTEPDLHCEHNCKGLCMALDVALTQEKQAMKTYSAILDTCVYPDIRVMLGDLIHHHQKSLQLLEDTRGSLSAKFEVLDQIQEGFDVVP